METKAVENSQPKQVAEQSAQNVSSVQPRPKQEAGQPKSVDAVKVRIVTDNKKAAEKETNSINQNADEIRKAAEELREDFESAFDYSETDVQFDVNLRDPSRDLSFKVIERETGKVLREFPPESLSKAKDLGVLDPGLLVNESA